jgi:AcrR family transcriptional regulator
VTRGAPYGHFADKETLLTEVAAEGWERIGDQMHALRTDSRLPPEATLRAALASVLLVSRQQPHLYRLMFSAPESDPAAVVRAAQRLCDEFLAIVAAVVSDQDAQRCAAVLLTAAHGAAGLEMSGLLHTDKWHTTGDELIESLVAMVAEVHRRA